MSAGGVVGAVLVGIAFLAVVGSCSSDEEDGGGEIGAEVMCREFVEDRLKAPASAEFNDGYTTTIGQGTYRVSASVDSENSFGALIRTGYTCEIRFDPSDDSWTLLGLNLDD